MKLKFVESRAIEPRDISDLREAVGWDRRPAKIEQASKYVYCRWGCFDCKKLVGFLEAVSDGVDDAYLRNLIVHPLYQRRGIAAKLLEMAKKRIRDDGIKMVNILFEPELTSLYRKAGFRVLCGGLIDNEETDSGKD